MQVTEFWTVYDHVRPCGVSHSAVQYLTFIVISANQFSNKMLAVLIEVFITRS